MTRTVRAALLAFVVAFATLFSQVLIHRLITAKLTNSFAFLVISLTMLGFALSGVALTYWKEAVERRLPDALVRASALFVLSLLGASLVFCGAVTKPWIASRAEFVWSFLGLMPLSLLFALPFAFCGWMLGALLWAPELDVRRVYGADLAGSAAGAFAALPAVSALGVEAALVAACALVLAGGFLLGPPKDRISWALATAAAITVVLAARDPARLLAIRYPEGTVLAATQDKDGGIEIEDIVWDPVARIELSRVRPPTPESFVWPSLIGGNRDFHSRFQKVITQNNNAFTYGVHYDGNRASLRGIEETIYAAAYVPEAVPNPRVLTVGVGGGFDILAGLYFGAAEVTGIEVNAATVDIVTRRHRDYFRGWVEDPRVRLVEAEGRHYLARSDVRFDVIQLSGVDSASGVPGAAHVFSENYLYTAEAFDLYLSRLTDLGILCVMRPEFAPPREMLRGLVTLVGSLRRLGVAEPRRHVVMVTAREGNIVSMIVKRAPFTDEELGRIAKWTAANGHFQISASPADGPGAERRLHRIFLGQGSPEREEAFVRAYPFDIAAVSDDRPFYFKYSTWGHLVSANPTIAGTIPVMELSLLLLLGLTGVAATVCVYAPMRLLVLLPRSGVWRYGLFFACTGVGYLFVEVALLQKFSLFLGHPNYSLSVVMAALLFFTGIGSLGSASILSACRGLPGVCGALVSLVLLENFLLIPALPLALRASFALRCLTVFALVAPVGTLLGVFLPTALDRLKQERPEFVPWAWGIGGIASVLAPILAVALSTTFGIAALLLASLPFYLVAVATMSVPAGSVPATEGVAPPHP